VSWARLRAILPAAFGVLAVALAVYAVVGNWPELNRAIRKIGTPALIASLLFGVVGVYAACRTWREILVGLGARPPARTSDRLFFVSQLGKYLPGSVWPVLAQMEFGKRIGTNRRTMLAANLIATALIIAIGLVLAGICLPLSSPAALHRFWWTLLLIPMLLLLVHPRAIPMSIDWSLKLVGHESIDARVPLTASLRGAAWSLLGWLGLGAHLFMLTRALGAHGTSGFLAAIGGEALAVCAGILFIPAPAGAGIRDAVLVATLAPTLGATSALAVALTSRVLLIAVDLLLAAVFGLVGRSPEIAPSTVTATARPTGGEKL
jgi:hypothetical protein